MQTAYLKVIDGRARYAGQSEFRAFLFGVIRRTAVDERRRRAIRATLPLTLLFGREPAALNVAHPGLAPIERAEESRRLVAALDQLPSRQREVLHLVFYQDLTIAAAADVLGISVGSARTHYERGKTQLRQLLGDGPLS